MVVVPGLRLYKFVRSWRSFSSIPTKAVVGHGESTEFHINVWAFSKFGNVDLPVLENGFSMICKRPNTEWRSKMIENHRGAWHCAGKGYKLG